MLNQRIRIATHQSPLALMYTEKIVSDIQRLHPNIRIELVKVATKGDEFYFEPPPDWGGKCLFIRDVDQTLLDGQADIAVHVIEERPRTGASWPRGWLSAMLYNYGDEGFYFITDLRRIPELFFHNPKTHWDE